MSLVANRTGEILLSDHASSTTHMEIKHPAVIRILGGTWETVRATINCSSIVIAFDSYRSGAAAEKGYAEFEAGL